MKHIRNDQLANVYFPPKADISRSVCFQPKPDIKGSVRPEGDKAALRLEAPSGL